MADTVSPLLGLQVVFTFTAPWQELCFKESEDSSQGFNEYQTTLNPFLFREHWSESERCLQGTENNQGLEKGDRVWPGAAGAPKPEAHTSAPGLGEAGLSSHEATQTTAAAPSFLCSFRLPPSVGEKSRDSGALAGFQGMFLHFFCRMFCLALMNARMSESVWLSPVRGMDDIGLSQILRTNTSHNFKSHCTVFLDVAFPK